MASLQVGLHLRYGALRLLDLGRCGLFPPCWHRPSPVRTGSGRPPRWPSWRRSWPSPRRISGRGRRPVRRAAARARRSSGPAPCPAWAFCHMLRAASTCCQRAPVRALRRPWRSQPLDGFGLLELGVQLGGREHVEQLSLFDAFALLHLHAVDAACGFSTRPCRSCTPPYPETASGYVW